MNWFWIIPWAVIIIFVAGWHYGKKDAVRKAETDKVQADSARISEEHTDRCIQDLYRSLEKLDDRVTKIREEKINGDTFEPDQKKETSDYSFVKEQLDFLINFVSRKFDNLHGDVYNQRQTVIDSVKEIQAENDRQRQFFIDFVNDLWEKNDHVQGTKEKKEDVF